MTQFRQSTIAAVILAAGTSTRMGQQKLLLPWGSSTVIGHIAHVWKDLTARVFAVVRDPSDERGRGVAAELESAGIPRSDQIVNRTPVDMFSSIRAAAAWPSWPRETTRIAVVLGDQPQLDRHRILAPLLAAAACHGDQITQPAFDGAPKHPVVFPFRLFLSLATSPCSTLREALSAMSSTLVPVYDPLVNLDLDTPQDYEHARRIVFAGRS